MNYSAVSWCLFFLCYLAHGSYSKIVKGHVIGPANWKYLSRFCFAESMGHFEYKLKFAEQYQSMKLLIYYSTEWNSINRAREVMSCEKKTSMIQYTNRVFKLTNASKGGCFPSNEFELTCRNRYRFNNSHEHWVYFAISNCGSSKGINVRYTLVMLNGGGFFRKHYSADQFILQPLYAASLIAHIVLLFASIFVVKELIKQKLLHTTYKLFILTLTLKSLSELVFCFAYLQIGITGVENRSHMQVGHIFAAGAEIVFVSMLVLMASGYTVTYARFSLNTSFSLIFFLFGYILAYIVIFVWEDITYDDSKVVYRLESPAGYCLLTLSVAVWLWFTVLIVQSLSVHQNKAFFYGPLFVYYTAWFWNGPITAIVGVTRIDSWRRESIYVGVKSISTFGGYLFFWVLTLPAKFNKNFPYHIRNNQVNTDPTTTLVTELQPHTSHQAPLTMYSQTHGPDLTRLFQAKSTQDDKKPENPDDHKFPPILRQNLTGDGAV